MPEETNELEVLKLQLAELKESFGKLNERFSGLGKAVLDNFNRISSMVELATKPAPEPVKIRAVYPNHSETIGKITLALSQAKPEINDIKPTGVANRGNYATFDDMMEVIDPVLKKYELSVEGFLETNELGEFVAILMLSHSSGEWFKSRALLYENKVTTTNIFHQQIGSAESYHLRNMLRAMFCLGKD